MMSVKYALKELLVRRHITIINCIGIAAAVALIISLYTLSNAYKTAIKHPFEASGIDLVLEKQRTQKESSTAANGIVLPDSARPITDNEVQHLRDMDGIENISTTLQIWSFDKGNFKVIAGIDPDGSRIGPAKFVDWVKDGSFFEAEDKGVAVVEKHFAKYHGIKVGGKVEIAGELFKITGTVEVKEGSQLAAPNFFLPISEARRMARVEKNDVNAVYIRLDRTTDTKAVIERIREKIPGIHISFPDSSLSVADSIFSLSKQFTSLISIVTVIAAGFLIFKTVAANIFERIREIGIMKAVGWTKSDIQSQLALEMLLQAVTSGIIGIIAGLLLSFSLSRLKINAPLPWQGSPIPGSAGMAATSTELVQLQISVSVLFISAVYIFSVLTVLICGQIASRKASSVKPAELLRKI